MQKDVLRHRQSRRQNPESSGKNKNWWNNSQKFKTQQSPATKVFLNFWRPSKLVSFGSSPINIFLNADYLYSSSRHQQNTDRSPLQPLKINFCIKLTQYLKLTICNSDKVLFS